MAKAAKVKVRVDEVRVGQTVEANLISGSHEVAEIRTAASHLRNTSTEYTFYNAAGELFFVGRPAAKATLA